MHRTRSVGFGHIADNVSVCFQSVGVTVVNFRLRYPLKEQSYLSFCNHQIRMGDM